MRFQAPTRALHFGIILFIVAAMLSPETVIGQTQRQNRVPGNPGGTPGRTPGSPGGTPGAPKDKSLNSDFPAPPPMPRDPAPTSNYWGRAGSLVVFTFHLSGDATRMLRRSETSNAGESDVAIAAEVGAWLAAKGYDVRPGSAHTFSKNDSDPYSIDTLKRLEVKAALVDGRASVDPAGKQALVLQAKLIRIEDGANLGVVRAEASREDVASGIPRLGFDGELKQPTLARVAAWKFADALDTRYKESVRPRTTASQQGK